MQRMKLVCTIGPETSEAEEIEALAVGGMNAARVNMCHGTQDWHHRVKRQVRRLNEEKGFDVAVMMDTEGSDIHMGDLGGSAYVKAEVTYFHQGREVRWVAAIRVCEVRQKMSLLEYEFVGEERDKSLPLAGFD